MYIYVYIEVSYAQGCLIQNVLISLNNQQAQTEDNRDAKTGQGGAKEEGKKPEPERYDGRGEVRVESYVCIVTYIYMIHYRYMLHIIYACVCYRFDPYRLVCNACGT